MHRIWRVKKCCLRAALVLWAVICCRSCWRRGQKSPASRGQFRVPGICRRVLPRHRPTLPPALGWNRPCKARMWSSTWRPCFLVWAGKTICVPTPLPRAAWAVRWRALPQLEGWVTVFGLCWSPALRPPAPAGLHRGWTMPRRPRRFLPTAGQKCLQNRCWVVPLGRAL